MGWALLVGQCRPAAIRLHADEPNHVRGVVPTLRHLGECEDGSPGFRPRGSVPFEKGQGMIQLRDRVEELLLLRSYIDEEGYIVEYTGDHEWEWELDELID